MSGEFRRERLAREIFRQVSLVLLYEAKDPEFALVTVTRVELSPDFSSARILVSGMGRQGPEVENRIRRMNRARGFIGMRVNQLIGLRKAVEVRFAYDKGADNVEKVEREIRKLREEGRS